MEAKTYTYSSATNTLYEQLPEEWNPERFDANAHPDLYEEYKARLASLKEIACEPGCKDIWKDGQEVIDGKDFETRLFYHAPDDKELRAYLIKAESEDDGEVELLWESVVDIVYDNVGGAPEGVNHAKAVEQLKQEYTISKKK